MAANQEIELFKQKHLSTFVIPVRAGIKHTAAATNAMLRSTGSTAFADDDVSDKVMTCLIMNRPCKRPTKS